VDIFAFWPSDHATRRKFYFFFQTKSPGAHLRQPFPMEIEKNRVPETDLKNETHVISKKKRNLQLPILSPEHIKAIARLLEHVRGH
jgi:hypothetical protein